MKIKKTKWVVGFLIRKKKEVSLVLKTHPAWQAGKLNGVGGKIEKGESAQAAMRREFKEETGLLIRNWRKFALLKVQDGEVHFFVAHGGGTLKSMTDEAVRWYKIKDLKKIPIISNLEWLIPLALDAGNKITTIDYFQTHH